MKIAMAIRHLHRAGLTEFICLKCVWLMILCCSTIAADEPIDFSKQIGPILEQHCVRCHSPGNNKGDVSLTTFDDLKSNDYVIAGDPDDSYLIELVTSQDGEPPAMPKEAKPLSDTEVELLRQWIGQGAKWPDDVVIKEKAKADASWWAYQPLNVARLSESSSTHTPDSESRATTIDDFIRAKLAERQLKPSPRANRRTLIRRLSFDLHGLPPTPEAVEAFVEDDNPKAYEKLVDRMLESPHYGERFAQHWLDIAHYADTHGFERDKRRDNAWRYRDYVIRALNEDKPYDRFLQEQIAGDVLWPDNEQAVIATGFLAAGPWDFVGQVETKSPVLRRSARSLDLDDMATQVITATMAMTINCARCHDHKIDPISQREYYQLRAVFAGVKREDRVVSDAALKQYEVQKQKLIARRNKLDFEKGRLEGEGLNLADIVGGGNGLGTGTYRNAIDPRNAKVQTRNFGNLGNVVTNRFSLSAFEFVDGVFIPDGDNGKAEIPVSSTGVTVTGLPKTSGKAWDMIRNGPVASQHSPELDGIDFTKDGHHLLGLHANAGITFDLAAMRRVTRLSESSSEPPDSESQAALRFTATLGYFGAVGNNFADAWVFVDGRKVAEFRKLRRADGLQKIDVELPASARFLTLVSTDGGNGYGMDQIGFGDPRVKLASPPTLTDESRNRLAKIKAQREQIEKDLETLGPPPRFYGVVAQKTVPEVRLLTRGNPESPSGDALRPAALSSLVMLDSRLGTLDTLEGERRAALARWITHPDNPLVHRVIVNRMWQWHFGTGLVDTPSDFGYGGGRPSHPELLDWLAGELAKRNWSLKAMHRLIVTSETYKQSSSSQIRDNSDKPGEERLSTRESSSTRAMAIDADNRLLWRQNPRRIDAEAIRDSVLHVSGKLNSKRGGPGFEDFQYQDAYAPIYTYVTADEPTLWRRSIYRYIVRTTPDRFLTTLDCPDPANFTPKRLTTTTPLQSLALYNNDFILRQARYFARRLEEEAGEDVSAQVKQAFALAFGRQPSAEEDRLAMDFVNKQGLFALCRSLLNSNEFLYVD